MRSLWLLGTIVLLQTSAVGGQDTLAEDLAAAAKSRRVHAFFYLWYGNPSTDGQWQHWNHEVLPHWDKNHPTTYPQVKYLPPTDIHSPYYPKRGCYSSRDPDTLRGQFTELVQTGVGVVVVSWSGRPLVPGAFDTQGVRTDGVLAGVLDAAVEAGMEVALHLEPYEGRSALSVREDIRYLIEKYGHHKALHRTREGGLPVFYAYDSYRIPTQEWLRVLAPEGDLSVRGTGDDCCMLGLWLDQVDGSRIKEGGFNGMYTYFASDGFTYGSTTSNWNSMAAFARAHNLLFVPSVGPGYDDSKIRPWNTPTKRSRKGGLYYDTMWGAAMASGAYYVSITSYNEWGEGTQIEPAIEMKVGEEGRLEGDVRKRLGLADRYSDYGPYGSEYYLQRTAYWSVQLASEEEGEDVEGEL